MPVFQLKAWTRLKLLAEPSLNGMSGLSRNEESIAAIWIISIFAFKVAASPMLHFLGRKKRLMSGNEQRGIESE